MRAPELGRSLNPPASRLLVAFLVAEFAKADATFPFSESDVFFLSTGISFESRQASGFKILMRIVQLHIVVQKIKLLTSTLKMTRDVKM
eukprot:m.31796 g.31796  ORF g.31796 m.31796 type:complete len:89 (+) comp6973_c0_seq1:4055-4321(+)